MSASVDITATVKEIRETEEVGSNGFKKRLMVVDTGGEYPQELPIEFVQAKTDLLDKFDVGEKLIISCNIRGRAYEKNFETNYFLSLQGWRIVKSDA